MIQNCYKLAVAGSPVSVAGLDVWLAPSSWKTDKPHTSVGPHCRNKQASGTQRDLMEEQRFHLSLQNSSEIGPEYQVGLKCQRK